MKIGFVLDDGLDVLNGVQQYIVTLGKYYNQQGHEIRYLVGETKRKDIPGVYSLAENLTVKFNGNTLTIPFKSSDKKIKKVLSAEDFDVLHVQVPYSPFLASKIIKNSSKKTAIVGTFHILPYSFVSKIGAKILYLAVRRSLKRFNGFMSVSEPAADFALATFNIRGNVIPNSVEISQFRRKKEKLPAGELNIVFLGRLVPRKGCKQLIQALAFLEKSQLIRANWHLNVCGSGAMMQELKDLAAREQLENKITFHGFVSEEKKITMMQAADISVFPSLSGESFGIVLLEAMAAGGGVVLGGNNPGYRSVLHTLPDSLIDPADPKIMAKQMVEFINSEKKRKSLYILQQKLVQKYDTPVVAKSVFSVYESCNKR